MAPVVETKYPRAPEGALWKLRGSSLDPRRRFPLQDRECVGNRMLGWYGDIEMDVFITYMPGMDVKPFPFCNRLEYSLQFEFNMSVPNYLSAVFGAPDYVVITFPRTMRQLVQASIHGQ